jgi:hypothetical protein
MQRPAQLAVAAVLVTSTLLAPAAASGHDVSEDSARSAAAWVGERGVEDTGLPFRRSRAATCFRPGGQEHTHLRRCDLMLVGPDDDPSLALEPGADFGCLYKVTVSFADEVSTSLVEQHQLFDCTSGSPALYNLDRDSSFAVPELPADMPPAPPPAALDVHAPFGNPAADVFTQWGEGAGIPLSPYPVTLYTQEECPVLGPDFYCALLDDTVYFEEVETADEANGPLRYDFLHELGHLYEYDVFTWAGDLRRRFLRAARVKSTAGNPSRTVKPNEKFAEAFASCAFDEKRLAPYRAYRGYGWRPPVAVHRRLCGLIRASWRRFERFSVRPSRSRPPPFALR